MLAQQFKFLQTYRDENRIKKANLYDIQGA